MNTFEIWQLKDIPELRYHRFVSLATLRSEGNRVEQKNYEKVYTGELEDGMSAEDIFCRFNMDIPQGFTGHSLSTSDIVVMHQEGVETALYCDSAGFTEVPEFLAGKDETETEHRKEAWQ